MGQNKDNNRDERNKRPIKRKLEKYKGKEETQI